MSPLFTDQTAESLAAIGEDGLLKQLPDWLAKVTSPPPFGVGDDAAVIDFAGAGRMLVTVDGVIAGLHFEETLPPENVAAKLLKRNLSDIAAMGGLPGPALLALTASPQMRLDWLETFFRGLSQQCDHFGVTIVGGDVSEGPDHFFSAMLTLHGTVDQAVTRQGAKAGDHLFVTGELGGSILEKHWSFSPRLREGHWLARQNNAIRSMIDLSDGLAKDLPELVGEGLAATIDPEALPVSEAAQKLAETSGKTPLAHALCDGEDYELLFTLNGQLPVKRFLAAWKESFETPITPIGQIVNAESGHSGKILDARSGEPIEFGDGFSHWKRG